MRIRFHLASVTALAIVCSTSAQMREDNTSARPGTRSDDANAYTLRRQRGQRLLTAAETNARTFSPGMHAYVLWQVAQVYQNRSNQRKAERLFREAFLATLNAELPDVSKRYLQREILQKLTAISPDEGRELQTSAESSVRTSLAVQLVDDDVKKGYLEKAREDVMRVAADGDFPYEAAVHLLLRLPVERRSYLFAQALTAYRAQGSTGDIQREDLGSMVVRFWRDLPRATVIEAVDLIFQRARNDEKNRPTVMTSSTGAALNFDSTYEYRLFQLLPVLQELEPSRYKELLNDQVTLQAALEHYPSGFQSFTPEYGDRPLTKPKTVMTLIRTDRSLSDAALDIALEQISSREGEIALLAGTDPKAAMVKAPTLPETMPKFSMISPRGDVLTVIARSAARTDPVTAKDALNQVRSLSDRLSPYTKADLLGSTVDVYRMLNDDVSALRVLSEITKLAERVYAEDSDADDPNIGLKASWPSANLWSKLINIAERISEDEAMDIISSIPDAEIRTAQEVRLAALLLNMQISDVELVYTGKKNSNQK